MTIVERVRTILRSAGNVVLDASLVPQTDLVDLVHLAIDCRVRMRVRNLQAISDDTLLLVTREISEASKSPHHAGLITLEIEKA